MTRHLRLWAALCALAVYATTAWGQVVVSEPNSFRGILQGIPISGLNRTDSTARVITVTPSGYLQAVDPDRDRDFSIPRNLFNSVVLNPSTTYQPLQPCYIGQYSRASLMLSWGGAAAADSDTTFLMVRVWGKRSMNDGNMYLWTPFTKVVDSGDTCYCNKTVADSAGAPTACITPPPSFVVTRANVIPTAGWTKVVAGIYGGTATTRVSLRKIPAWALRFAGSTGVMLPLSDEAGNQCPYPYIFVEVANLSFSRALTGVTCDVWPRVF